MSDTSSARVILLRHGEVTSHKGDVPVTQRGLNAARHAGKSIGAGRTGPITVLYGGTRRTRETAEQIVEGVGDPGRVSGPANAFALRNPDVYVCGVRVDMVSSAAALAAQVPGLDEHDAGAHPFFAEFIPAPDRIGWWLSLPDPPGENADAVADRVAAFARSTADPGPLRGSLVVGVTHSPVIRSILRRSSGHDPGEPAYVTGAELVVRRDGSMTIHQYDPAGDEEAT
ncbi:histidine phosphatase family protein [Actinobacteria bacterium YIM 96077]|uniref:Histidine phosphatase family protein n=1 Tax=Phytoactinopolyspora halophila TaxID=1981511 RepID=A0A329QAK9_9ACTN|nr:histidine phosphatase family protein [Phytoactinopolyspora halophila]AYY13714.1 histidine phosphatase family protein [Actinobacteria bacterium YIM 96077]RAW09354.1 hypothetical protein DPM12_21505 [Phytoactinopolyspora halophila]